MLPASICKIPVPFLFMAFLLFPTFVKVIEPFLLSVVSVIIKSPLSIIPSLISDMFMAFPFKSIFIFCPSAISTLSPSYSSSFISFMVVYSVAYLLHTSIASFIFT